MLGCAGAPEKNDYRDDENDGDGDVDPFCRGGGASCVCGVDACGRRCLVYEI